jgi:hypothetical protein
LEFGFVIIIILRKWYYAKSHDYHGGSRKGKQFSLDSGLFLTRGRDCSMTA